MANKIITAGFMLTVLVWQAHAAVNCTTAGRFADPSDTTCQNYTLCVYSSSTGSYIAYNYVCPSTSMFNPATSLCTSNYVCDVTTTSTTSTTTTTTTTSTTTSTTTEATTNSPNTTSVCTSEGYVADPSSTNCFSYIECVDIDGTYKETAYTCPDGTYYDPNTTFCDPDYNCTSSDSFTCTTTGRFPDISDTTCQSYYYCILLSNDSYTQYNYTCPSSSMFDPIKSVCTTDYICTTTTTTTTTTSTTTSTTTEATTNSTNTTSVCTSEGYLADPSSTNCSSYIECVDIDGMYEDTTYTCPDGTYYNPNTTFCDPDYNCTSTDSFTCTTTGRFPDTSDTTCQSYYYCILLSNDSYTQYNYTCPSTSMFDPIKSVCTTDYTCTTTTTTTTTTSTTTSTTTEATTNSTNTTSVCTSEGYLADPSSTNCSSYIECVDIDGTYEDTIYTCPDGTYYNPNTTFCDPDYNCTSTDSFTCTTTGRFPDTSDTTCQSYYYCILLSSDSYTQYNYTCPSTSMFDPIKSICTTDYICTTTTTTTTTTSTTTEATTNSTNTTSVCTSEGYLADPSSTNCSSYIECVDIDGTYEDTIYTCPDGTYYNPNTTFCDPDYNCTSTDSFTCTTTGRFPDTSDTTCQSYYYCILLSNDSYTQYNYTCPSTSMFDPTKSLCTTDYTCTTSTTTTTTTSTTTSTTTEATSNSTNTTSVCTSEGYLSDPSSTNCTSYIECVDIDGTYEDTTYTCPDGTYYNPNTTFCDPDYNCTSTDSFTCTTTGRFPDTSDTTCQSYYYCILLSNDSYTQYNYTCPSTSMFDPIKSVCTTDYTCTS